MSFSYDSNVFINPKIQEPIRYLLKVRITNFLKQNSDQLRVGEIWRRKKFLNGEICYQHY